MYDEPVAALRRLSDWSIMDFEDNLSYANQIAEEAADAIDALTAYVRQIEELRKDGYYLQKTKMMTYGQAIMTMPLPEPPKEGMK